MYNKYVKYFRKIGRDDIHLVGKKAYDLSHLYEHELNIPFGFAITTIAFDKYIRSLGHHVDRLLADIDKGHGEAAVELQKLILNSHLPHDIAEEIEEAYDSMNIEPDLSPTLRSVDILKAGQRQQVVVKALGVSDTAPQSAAEHDFVSFLGVTGLEQLSRAVKACIASVFTSKNIALRQKQHVPHDDIKVSVLIQRMVHAEKSGFLHTSSDTAHVSKATATFGLSAALTDDVAVEGDTYLIDKVRGRVLQGNIGHKKWAYFRADKGKLLKQELPEHKTQMQVLSAYETAQLARLAEGVEEKFHHAYVIEYAFEKQRLFVLSMKVAGKDESDDQKKSDAVHMHDIKEHTIKVAQEKERAEQQRRRQEQAQFQMQQEQQQQTNSTQAPSYSQTATYYPQSTMREREEQQQSTDDFDQEFTSLGPGITHEKTFTIPKEIADNIRIPTQRIQHEAQNLLDRATAVEQDIHQRRHIDMLQQPTYLREPLFLKKSSSRLEDDDEDIHPELPKFRHAELKVNAILEQYKQEHAHLRDILEELREDLQESLKR